MRSPEKQHPVSDLLRVCGRRRRIMQTALAASMVVAVLLCMFVTRRYDASGTIQLQKSSSDGMGLDSMISGASGGASDALSLNIDMQTQSAILKSKPLELRVIQKLNLESTRDFKPTFNPFVQITRLMSPSGPPDPAGAALEDSPARSERLLAVFQKNFKVNTEAGTRLIEVHYTDSDPRVAPGVVNALMAELIEFNFQVRFRATDDASKWLEGQLTGLREQSEALQARVVQLQKSTGLFGVGGVDPQGKPVIYSPALDRLQASNAALNAAESNAILKGAVSRIVSTSDPETLSELSGPMSGAGAGVLNSLSLIQSERVQESSAKTQEQEDAQKYGDNNPRLMQDRAALSAIQKLIGDEKARIARRASNDYEAAKQVETGLRGDYERDRSAAERLNDKTIEYTILQREADQSQQLYQNLLSRLKEAGVLEGLHTSNLTVMASARQPARPTTPNIPLYLASGLGVGLILGLCAAMLRDTTDNHIQSIVEVEEMGFPVLGVFPVLGARQSPSSLPMLATPHSDYAEAMRKLRSSLQLSHAGSKPKVLLVTSASAAEGKSTLAVNLAVAYAQGGHRVLLVETDMRRPVLKNRFGLAAAPGLSEILSDSEVAPKELVMPGVRNLMLIAAGPVPPSPADLLGSPRFSQVIDKWRWEFDVVVLDSPPVLPVSDAHITAQYADATLLVARAGVTTRASLERAHKMLIPHLPTPMIGVVFNGMQPGSQADIEYYGRSQAPYYAYKSEPTTNGHHRLPQG